MVPSELTVFLGAEDFKVFSAENINTILLKHQIICISNILELCSGKRMDYNKFNLSCGSY